MPLLLDLGKATMQGRRPENTDASTIVASKSDSPMAQPVLLAIADSLDKLSMAAMPRAAPLTRCATVSTQRPANGNSKTH